MAAKDPWSRKNSGAAGEGPRRLEAVLSVGGKEGEDRQDLPKLSLEERRANGLSRPARRGEGSSLRWPSKERTPQKPKINVKYQEIRKQINILDQFEFFIGLLHVRRFSNFSKNIRVLCPNVRTISRRQGSTTGEQGMSGRWVGKSCDWGLQRLGAEE